MSRQHEVKTGEPGWGAALLVAGGMILAGCSRLGPDGAGSTFGESATRCRVDADCTLATSMSCCPGCGGPTPPYVAVRGDYWRDRQRRKRERCARRKQRCPYINCPQPSRCRVRPLPRCRAGRCAVEIALGGSCAKTEVAGHRCGPYPHSRAGYPCRNYGEWLWLHCHCTALDLGDCERLRRRACYHEAKCRPHRRPSFARCPR